MPLPEKFYDSDGNECSLDLVCVREPAWVANRIRSLTEQIDKIVGNATRSEFIKQLPCEYVRVKDGEGYLPR